VDIEILPKDELKDILKARHMVTRMIEKQTKKSKFSLIIMP
jgi:hypothetical protein